MAASKFRETSAPKSRAFSQRPVSVPCSLEGNYDATHAFLVESNHPGAAAGAADRRLSFSHGAEPKPVAGILFLLRDRMRVFIRREPRAVPAQSFCPVAFHSADRLGHWLDGIAAGNGDL